ncbi:MAG: glycosyltransferase family 2 protein [Rickettsiales bacterium]|nr:glycosyltransferase family 2 protein [Rickettsiales bacterium]
MSSKRLTPMLSIIVPMYNEAEGIPQLMETLKPALDKITQDWELICVDDGSRDSTADAIAECFDADDRIKLVRLSRNFGKEIALTAGLFHAQGDAVIPMDADLQDPPELIAQMVEKWREGYKVVLATRRFRRGDGWFKRQSALMFYRIIRRLSHVAIPKNTGDFRLMDREVVEAIKRMPERTRFMKGILSWVGYPTTHVYYDRPDRAAGESKFNFVKLWKLALDGVFSFSTVPLQIWTYMGAIIASVSFGYAIYLIGRTMLYGADVPGYASLMVAVLFMGGIQLVSLGVIGEYIGRIYRETKRRPLYLVDTTLGTEKVDAFVPYARHRD